MPPTRLPGVLQRALDAQAASDACDRRLHPRIASQLWKACHEARKLLVAEYPETEGWLFGYPYLHHAERLAELQRLITASKETP